mgnify:CR=1 FL=1
MLTFLVYGRFLAYFNLTIFTFINIFSNINHCWFTAPTDVFCKSVGVVKEFFSEELRRPMSRNDVPLPIYQTRSVISSWGHHFYVFVLVMIIYVVIMSPKHNTVASGTRLYLKQFENFHVKKYELRW